MKNKQAIYTLFAANTISGFAQGISMIAIPWYFTNVLNLPNVLGWLFMGILWVSLFWGIYAGSLVDRFNRKYLYISIQSVACFMLLAIAGYGFYKGELNATLVGLVYASTFFVYNIHYPNLYAFLQEITDPKDYGRITSYIEIQGQTTTALAGTLAAVLLKGTTDGNLTLAGMQLPVNFQIDAWKLHEIFLMDGITYVVATLLIVTIRFVPVAHRYREELPIIQRLKLGFNFLMENPMVMLFGIFGSNVFVAVLILNFYLKPIYVANHLQESADIYASYELYFALGSLFSGITIRYLFKNATKPFAVIVLTLIAAAVCFVYSFNTVLAIVYIGAFLLGLSNAGNRIMRVTYLFERIPNQIIGRTHSIFASANVIFRMFFTAIFLLPFFYQEDHIIWAYVIFSAFLSLTALTLIIYYKRIVAKPKVNKPGEVA